jgi:hypothetical protein
VWPQGCAAANGHSLALLASSWLESASAREQCVGGTSDAQALQDPTGKALSFGLAVTAMRRTCAESSASSSSGCLGPSLARLLLGTSAGELLCLEQVTSCRGQARSCDRMCSSVCKSPCRHCVSGSATRSAPRLRRAVCHRELHDVGVATCKVSYGSRRRRSPSTLSPEMVLTTA